MTTYKIHLIRHGLTMGNLKGWYVGRTDLPLCQEGRSQLSELADACGYPDAQKVYSSPLLRCLQTADLLYPDRLCETVDDLTELDFGEFDGRPLDELKQDPAFQQWTNAGLRTAPPGGESNESMEVRASSALEHIFADMMRQKITSTAIITHGGVIATLMAKYALEYQGGQEVPESEGQGQSRHRAGLYQWLVQSGCGYTILMTPQMWMRDGGFEVFEPLPYRIEAYRELGPERFRKELREWESAQASRMNSEHAHADPSSWEDPCSDWNDNASDDLQ